MNAGAVAFIGDVHLDVGDPEVGPFLSFLQHLSHDVSRIVLLGDLFNLWIGSRDLEQPHQAAVTELLAELRGRGVVVRYLEGNRDYRVGACYRGSALDDVSSGGLEEVVGGKRVFAVHGDLANAADRQYRLWRRVSRSRPAWWLFRSIPPARRRRLVDDLEGRMRRTNVAFKRTFPEAAVREYTAQYFRAGYDAVVLGHFHIEKELDSGTGGRILVLPEWKGSRRHLEAPPGGELRFVDSKY